MSHGIHGVAHKLEVTQTDTPPVSVKSSISDQRLLTSPFALTFSATPVTNPDPLRLPAEPDGRQCNP
jgi:hypothetical protein